ncbi:hypothetical protein SprV_0802641800 [Sparganum proliferum]
MQPTNPSLITMPISILLPAPAYTAADATAAAPDASSCCRHPAALMPTSVICNSIANAARAASAAQVLLTPLPHT